MEVQDNDLNKIRNQYIRSEERFAEKQYEWEGN